MVHLSACFLAVAKLNRLNNHGPSSSSVSVHHPLFIRASTKKKKKVAQQLRHNLIKFGSQTARSSHPLEGDALLGRKCGSFRQLADYGFLRTWCSGKMYNRNKGLGLIYSKPVSKNTFCGRSLENSAVSWWQECKATDYNCISNRKGATRLGMAYWLCLSGWCCFVSVVRGVALCIVTPSKTFNCTIKAC